MAAMFGMNHGAARLFVRSEFAEEMKPILHEVSSRCYRRGLRPHLRLSHNAGLGDGIADQHPSGPPRGVSKALSAAHNVD